jgi:hypothetical protein
MRGKSYKGVVLSLAGAFLLLSPIQNFVGACPPQCPPCYYWNGSRCVWGCASGQFCCNNTCCNNGNSCCNNQTCCNTNNCKKCQGSQCVSKCTDTQYCCGGTCIPWEKWCCGGTTPCDTECCGDKCCSETQFCCGDETCCNANEVCCFTLGGQYYCKPPCSDQITDTTSCSQDNEDTYPCNDCKQVLAPPLGTYRDYTGLQISECYNGCPQFDWNTSDEICYQEKECYLSIHENSMCLECEGHKACFKVKYTPPLCETEGDCVAQVLCDIIHLCLQSNPGSTVVYTDYRETCVCN